MSSQMHLFIRVSQDRVNAPVSLGLVAVPDLVQQVREAFDAPGRHVTFDLSAVRSLDPRILRSIQWARRYARSQGGRLSLIPPRPGVLDSLTLLALIRHGDASRLHDARLEHAPSSVPVR